MNVKYVDIANNDSLLCVNCLTSNDIDTLMPYVHVHDELEIVYIKQGSLSLCINNTVSSVKANNLVVINRQVPHKFFDSNHASFIVLQFKPTKIYDSKKIIDIRYLTPFLHTQNFSHIITQVSTPILKDITSVIDEIEVHIKEHDIAYDLLIESNLIRLLYLMYKAHFFGDRITESVKQTKNLNQFSTLLKFIDSHYDELITLEQACTITKLDYHYFSRMFKEKTGKTFVEYLSFVRILNAQKLLTDTDEPIALIAKKVGIPNISYFNRKFKLQNGVSPSQYRKENQPIE